MAYNLRINGVYWVYNPLANLLLTSWDILVVPAKITADLGAPRRVPGFPDKFVRYSGGRRLFVHSRKDDPEVEFKVRKGAGEEG